MARETKKRKSGKKSQIKIWKSRISKDPCYWPGRGVRTHLEPDETMTELCATTDGAVTSRQSDKREHTQDSSRSGPRCLPIPAGMYTARHYTCTTYRVHTSEPEGWRSVYLLHTLHPGAQQPSAPSSPIDARWLAEPIHLAAGIRSPRVDNSCGDSGLVDIPWWYHLLLPLASHAGRGRYSLVCKHQLVRLKRWISKQGSMALSTQSISR